MKNLKLKIEIEKTLQEIFEFTLNPQNTPLWIKSIVREEVNESPAKLGAIYRNVNRNGKWSEYTITAFEKNRMFIMTSKDKNYHVRYTLKPINDNLTELEYYEWDDKGELERPFTLDILKKLKTVIENNNHKEHVEKVKEILKENLYMTISVASKKGVPWIANLYYAYDKKYNFYWYSPKNSVHSQRIRENPSVAIAIFDSRAVGDEVDAVYIKAKAHEIKNTTELAQGLVVYVAKMVRTKFIAMKYSKKFINQSDDFLGLSKLRMYKAIPEKFYKLAPSEMFNDKFIDSRIEVEMK